MGGKREFGVKVNPNEVSTIVLEVTARMSSAFALTIENFMIDDNIM